MRDSAAGAGTRQLDRGFGCVLQERSVSGDMTGTGVVSGCSFHGRVGDGVGQEMG